MAAVDGGGRRPRRRQLRPGPDAATHDGQHQGRIRLSPTTPTGMRSNRWFQKVMDARRDVGFGGGMGRMFRRGNRNGNNNNASANNNGGRRGGFGGTPSPEAEALQKAIDDNAPTAQIKAAAGKIQGFAKSQTSQTGAGAGKPSQGAHRQTGSPGHLARIARITNPKEKLTFTTYELKLPSQARYVETVAGSHGRGPATVFH